MRFCRHNTLLTAVAVSLFSGVAWAQAPNPAPATNPTPAPVAPAAPTTPAAPATGENPSVMLLQQGHTDSIRAKAADDLGKQGDRTTIPALENALKDPSAKVRREAVLSLADFHQSDVLPSIESVTKDADAGVRMTALQCLVGFYTGNLPPKGWTGFMKKNWQWAASHFETDDTRIDPGVNVDPSVVTTLVGIMKTSRANGEARQATKGLGILLASAAAPDLVVTAHSSDVDLAREALNALDKIKDRDSGPKLVDLLDSSNKDIKRDACVTVGILGTKDAVAKLQAVFQNDTDQKDRVAAIQGLAYLGDKVSVQLFTQALWNENKDIRQAAAEGLARAADPQSLSELQKASQAEKDGGPKLAIDFALAALGQDNALSDLVAELGKTERPDVARAYLTELARNPVFLTKLYPFLVNPDNSIRKRLCIVMMYSGDQTSLPQLDRLEHDSDSDVASTALKAKRAIRARMDSGAKS
jgi:HEAT repeat protein